MKHSKRIDNVLDAAMADSMLTLVASAQRSENHDAAAQIFSEFGLPELRLPEPTYAPMRWHPNISRSLIRVRSRILIPRARARIARMARQERTYDMPYDVRASLYVRLRLALERYTETAGDV